MRQALVALAALGIAACGSGPAAESLRPCAGSALPVPVPERLPMVRGEVEMVTRIASATDTSWSILLLGSGPARYPSGRTHVHLSDQSVLLCRAGGVVTRDQIRPGWRVAVWSLGMAESDPGQTGADTLLVESMR